MCNIIEINDIRQEGLDIFCHLTEAQLRNRLEPEKGIFIAESPKVIKVALDEGYAPISVLTEKRHIEGDARDIIRRCGDIPIYTGESSLLEKIAGYRLTRGVLCAMKRPKAPNVEEICEGKSRIVLLDSVADATNIGAIFRSAAALGIDAVLLNATCCDPLNRRAVRVSMGTVFQVPWTYLCQSPDEWPHPALERLSAMGFKTVAMALSDNSVSLDSPLLKKEEQLVIIMGTEGDGLSPRTIASADYTVRIPMSHGVDSLNVAAASAVAFWELRNNRQTICHKP